ncbi:MAG: hypothetical protein IKU07_04775 [Oscillospiraceae bacterium]|nr:hypothetical protein [Oscillospiraceae bacterium]
MGKQQKKLVILVACLAVLLVGCIIVAVVMMGNDAGKLPENPSEPTEQTQPTDDTEEATEPADTTAPVDATEPSGTTEATEPAQSGNQGGNQGSGNQGSGNQGSTGTNNKPTEPEEEDKTPTIGVDDETTPTGSDENNMVIDFDDLLEAANGKKNEG